MVELFSGGVEKFVLLGPIGSFGGGLGSRHNTAVGDDKNCREKSAKGKDSGLQDERAECFAKVFTRFC